MKHMIRISILVITIVVSLSFTSIAYTEEQKQQAKAWLSAHGYSPDMGGANQAYQDYLNGKFDEELGVDVNGDGIPAPTEASTEENTEEDADDYVDADVEEEENTEEDKADGKADTSSGTSIVGDKGEVTDAESIQDNVKKQEPTDAVEMMSDEKTTDDVHEHPDSNVDKEDVLVQSEKQEVYQKAAMVIVLSVVLMLLAGLWLKK